MTFSTTSTSQEAAEEPCHPLPEDLDSKEDREKGAEQGLEHKAACACVYVSQQLQCFPENQPPRSVRIATSERTEDLLALGGMSYPPGSDGSPLCLQKAIITGPADPGPPGLQPPPQISVRSVKGDACDTVLPAAALGHEDICYLLRGQCLQEVREGIAGDQGAVALPDRIDSEAASLEKLQQVFGVHASGL